MRLRIIIGSALNLAFVEWVTVFAGDEKLTTALLDRLAHHATVLTTQGEELPDAGPAGRGRRAAGASRPPGLKSGRAPRPAPAQERA